MSKNTKPVIVSDMDGVVCNLMEQVTIAIWKDFGIMIPEDMFTVFHVGEALYPRLKHVFDSPARVLDYIWERVFRGHDILLEAKPYYDVLQCYLAYQNAGGTVHMYTSRSEKLIYPTVKWCEDWGLCRPAFVSGGIGKRVFVENLVASIRAEEQQSEDVAEVLVVDDDPETLHTLMGISDTNVYIYKMPRPWNLNYTRYNQGLLHQIAKIIDSRQV